MCVHVFPSYSLIWEGQCWGQIVTCISTEHIVVHSKFDEMLESVIFCILHLGFGTARCVPRQADGQKCPLCASWNRIFPMWQWHQTHCDASHSKATVCNCFTKRQSHHAEAIHLIPSRTPYVADLGCFECFSKAPVIQHNIQSRCRILTKNRIKITLKKVLCCCRFLTKK